MIQTPDDHFPVLNHILHVIVGIVVIQSNIGKGLVVCNTKPNSLRIPQTELEWGRMP